MSDSYLLRPIARVRSAFTVPGEVPKGPGAEHTAEGVIEVFPEYAEGLLDLEGFSHLYVVWIFDRAEGWFGPRRLRGATARVPFIAAGCGTIVVEGARCR